MKKKIAVIGDCMIEINRNMVTYDVSLPKIPATISYGGDTLNSSIYMSRLGVEVDYVTALGDDESSAWLIEQWKAEGVGCDLVQFEKNASPGLYMINIDEHGERSFTYWRDSAPSRRLFDEKAQREKIFSSLLEYKMIYLSGITIALFSAAARDHLFEFLESYREQGGLVAFDTNFRARLWADKSAAITAYEKMYALTDIALPTIDDEQELFGDADGSEILKRIQGYGVNEIVLKKGAEGCEVYNVFSDPILEHVGTTRLDYVVDTTAAGDSFNAGYLASRLDGKDCKPAAVIGHKLAGAVVQHAGAIIPKTVMPEL